MRILNTSKSLKISYLFLFIYTISSHSVFSQIFDSEQNPLSVKFKQINSAGFKIIYPTELEKEAQRMANTLPYIYPFVGNSLGTQKTSIPIVLQNRGTIANGFVQLAPKKSQFYTTPPQYFDSQDWLNNLAVHELRHVAQFDKITKGKPRTFLQEIYFGYIGISAPVWFYEGDAVSIETSLTNAGRGRQPAWIMPYRTSLLNGKNFSYSKAYFGSNKDQTPGFYQLGYLMVSNLRKEFGKGIADSLLSDLQKKPLRPYPFSNSLKKYTGFNTNKYFKKTQEQLRTAWQAQDSLVKPENYTSLNEPAKFASNYFLPTAIENNKILALKQTKADVSGFVLINEDKTETQLFKIAYQEQPWFSYANGILVWDEIRFDPRYKQRSYSTICLYDFTTNRKKKISTKTRLFSPSLSANGKKLIAVQVDLSNHFNLVEIDINNGKILKTYPNPKNFVLQTPALNDDGSQISWISVNENGKSLWINENGTNKELISQTNQQLSRPVFMNDKIAFNAHLSGIDNIYEVDIETKKITPLTNAKYGAFNANLSSDKKSILFNSFQLMGYDIAKTPIEKLKSGENNFVYFGAAAEKQENTGNIFKNIPDSTYKSQSYKPLAHLFNFHSVSPTIDENEQLGLQLKSNDLLNTFDLYGGALFQNETRQMEYNAGFAYKALYPVISATLKNRPRTAFYNLNNVVNQANWRENHINIKASVPLSVNAFNHNYSFISEIGTTYTKRNYGPREAALFKPEFLFPMNYRFVFAHSVRTAERDVAPRWAQVLSISYFNQPFDKDLKGDLLALQTAFYFPGLAKNHSFMASFNYQERSGFLRFNNEIPTVFGYGQIKATGELQNTFLLNYRFPIAFPDAEIGALAYVKNLRGGFFSHYENIGNETNLTQPKTFGLELRSSLNLLRYQPVIDLGTRVIFANKKYNQNPILELIFNYSF